MLKSGKSFVKIGSRFQIALFFLFYQNFQTHSPTPRLFRPPAYLVLHNVPILRLLGPHPVFSEPKSKLLFIYLFIHNSVIPSNVKKSQIVMWLLIKIHSTTMRQEQIWQMVNVKLGKFMEGCWLFWGSIV